MYVIFWSLFIIIFVKIHTFQRDGCPKIVNLGSAKTDLFYERKKYGFKKRWAFQGEWKKMTKLLNAILFRLTMSRNLSGQSEPVWKLVDELQQTFYM